MTAEILTRLGTPTDPARTLFTVESERLNTGTRLSILLRSATPRLIEYPRVRIDETVRYPVYLWDWWQYILAKYDFLCDFANVRLSKVEQIKGFDFRFDVYARRQAEYVYTQRVEWEPIYTDEEPDRPRLSIDIGKLLLLRKHREPAVCPPIGTQTDRRVTAEGDLRTLPNGDVRIVRPVIEEAIALG